MKADVSAPNLQEFLAKPSTISFLQVASEFVNHWGQHCILALRAFHFLNYDGKDFI